MLSMLIRGYWQKHFYNIANICNSILCIWKQTKCQPSIAVKVLKRIKQSVDNFIILSICLSKWLKKKQREKKIQNESERDYSRRGFESGWHD